MVLVRKILIKECRFYHQGLFTRDLLVAGCVYSFWQGLSIVFFIYKLQI